MLYRTSSQINKQNKRPLTKEERRENKGRGYAKCHTPISQLSNFTVLVLFPVVLGFPPKCEASTLPAGFVLTPLTYFNFLRQGFLYSPNWPGTCYLNHIGLELTEIYLPLPPRCCLLVFLFHSSSQLKGFGLFKCS